MTAAIPSIALVGNPNAGKSSLFNALTGARQKIANYPGVTVERKAGHASFADGRPLSLIDLPGTYSLTPASLDEAVTRDVVLGRQEGETRPDALIVVLDAANLDNHLSFALELLALDLPTVVALNMVDLATRDGLTLDAERLSKELGVPVVPTVAVRKRGLTELLAAVDHVERDDGRQVQREQFERETEMIVEVRGVEHDDQRVGALLALLTAQHDVARHRLVEARGGQAVGAGKVDQRQRSAVGEAGMARLPLDGDTGIIGYLLPRAGQRVEQARLTRIGIADECDRRNGAGHAAGSTVIAAACLARMITFMRPTVSASGSREKMLPRWCGVTSHPSIRPNSRNRRPSSSDIAFQSIRAIRTITPKGDLSSKAVICERLSITLAQRQSFILGAQRPG